VMVVHGRNDSHNFLKHFHLEIPHHSLLHDDPDASKSSSLLPRNQHSQSAI
jgi:hypothetical protein